MLIETHDMLLCHYPSRQDGATANVQNSISNYFYAKNRRKKKKKRNLFLTVRRQKNRTKSKK